MFEKIPPEESIEDKESEFNKKARKIWLVLGAIGALAASTGVSEAQQAEQNPTEQEYSHVEAQDLPANFEKETPPEQFKFLSGHIHTLRHKILLSGDTDFSKEFMEYLKNWKDKTPEQLNTEVSEFSKKTTQEQTDEIKSMEVEAHNLSTSLKRLKEISNRLSV